MRLMDYMDLERTCFLAGETKRDALTELIDLISGSEAISDRDELEQAIWYREELMSTGIGLGIGVPHVRLESVREPVVAVGVRREGIEDYESLDGDPVQIIVMIAAGRKQHQIYIRLLAEVVAHLKEPGVRQSILEAEDPEALYTALAGESP